MKKFLLTLTLMSATYLMSSAQLCCNVVDGSGRAIVSSNGLCVVAPNLALSGCDNADADGDGVMNAEDNCPNEAGPAENMGCPELEETEVAVLKAAVAGVKFKLDSDELEPQSFEKLDAVVDLMEAHPDFILKISGHTDNSGEADYNLDLSDRRAHAAEKYIMSKGIASGRIIAKGYGQTDPVASNETEEGRAKNRRVEFDLIALVTR